MAAWDFIFKFTINTDNQIQFEWNKIPNYLVWTVIKCNKAIFKKFNEWIFSGQFFHILHLIKKQGRE